MRPDNTKANVPESATRRGRGALVVLIAIFAAPLVGAYLWWSFPELRPAGQTNHGELVQPARPLQDVALETLGSAPFGLENLRSRWTLVYFGRGPCDSVCATNLYNMRQLRTALGKNAERVQTLYVTGDANDRDLQAQAREHPQMLIVTGSRSSLDALSAQFVTAAGGPLQGEQRLYLIDPLGNLMMMFSENVAPSSILKDLKRLLRVSQIG